MQLENIMAFAKTEIICHGARATRIGERLVRHVWKYLQSTEFVKGNISENERKEMFDSISLKGIISYPDDIANLDTECDIIYQIITDDDSQLEEKLTLASENSNGIPCVVFVIGEKKDEIANLTGNEKRIMLTTWKECKIDGKTGWISGKYLRIM